MKACAYCGRENDDSAAECHECGTKEFKSPDEPKGSRRPKLLNTWRSRILVLIGGWFLLVGLMERPLIALCVWLFPGVGLWILSRWMRPTPGWRSIPVWALLRGLAVGWLLAPSIFIAAVPGGAGIIPAPALILYFVQPQTRLISVGSILVCSVIAFKIIYGRAPKP